MMEHDNNITITLMTSGGFMKFLCFAFVSYLWVSMIYVYGNCDFYLFYLLKILYN